MKVTKSQIEAAFDEWRNDSKARQSWVRHRGETKAIFDNSGQCYPPKKIFRIATREAVKELAAFQKSSIRAEVERGLNKLQGGYEILETYEASRQLGFKVKGGLSVSDKHKCG